MKPCKGLDPGTTNIVTAEEHPQKGVIFNIQRSAFLDLPCNKFSRSILDRLAVEYSINKNRLYIIGDPAFMLANVFEKDIRRPFKKGVLNPEEPEASGIIETLIEKLLGKATNKKEICAFSFAADPVDQPIDLIYHKGVIASILTKMGYIPRSVMEGLAVIYSDLADEDYTGIGISCGGGVCNICIAYKSMPAMSFSIARGGDWIDKNVAGSLGLVPSHVCAVKETVDLLNLKNQLEEAIAIYCRSLVQYIISTMKQKLIESDSLPTFREPVPLVIGGGMSLIGGFVELFKGELENISIPLSIKKVTQARNPLTTVANGLLKAAEFESSATHAN